MASYFSSITTSSALSNIGTRLNSLRRAITSGDEADDSENEDCSHISNVLRAYYSEKGRPFPPWLPPDPKAPAAAPPRVVATSQFNPPARTATSVSGGSVGGGGSGLGDLWGDSTSSSAGPTSQTASLRRGRGGAAGPSAIERLGAPLTTTHSAPSGSAAPTQHQQSRSYHDLPSSVGHPTGARPLPSQRAESYQTTPAAQQGRAVGLERASSGSSAQERLRARLHGGSSSPSPAAAAGTAPLQGSRSYGDERGAEHGRGGSEAGGRRPVGLPSGPRLRGVQ